MNWEKGEYCFNFYSVIYIILVDTEIVYKMGSLYVVNKE